MFVWLSVYSSTVEMEVVERKQNRIGIWHQIIIKSLDVEHLEAA